MTGAEHEKRVYRVSCGFYGCDESGWESTPQDAEAAAIGHEEANPGHEAGIKAVTEGELDEWC